MARKTDQERLEELERKIEEVREKKQQVASRIREKERKQRTRRLIQVGAIFEGYFEEEDSELLPEQAEQIALGLSKYVKENKEKFSSIDVEKSKEVDKIVYKEGEEKLIIPEEHKDNPYRS